jgi:hypothetical protein
MTPSASPLKLKSQLPELELPLLVGQSVSLLLALPWGWRWLARLWVPLSRALPWGWQ